MPSKYQIEIDLNACVGSTLCVHFAPGAFELNEEGQARVRTGAAAAEETDATVMEAAEQCPTCAIRLVDPDSGEQAFP